MDQGLIFWNGDTDSPPEYKESAKDIPLGLPPTITPTFHADILYSSIPLMTHSYSLIRFYSLIHS